MNQYQVRINLINERIAQLEAEKRSMRVSLNLSSAPSANGRARTPASSVGTPRRDAGLDRAASLAPTVEDAMDLDPPLDPDCILREPPASVFKAYTDRERNLKVRMPDVYKGKEL